MKLHAIAAPLAGVVNPPIPGALLRSTGYATSAAGKRTPSFADPEVMDMQVQALTAPELSQLDSLNIQGIKRAVHLPGDVKGLDRASNTGGDLITFGTDPRVPAGLQGTTWLVVLVMETWDASDWCRVAVVKQNGS